MAVPYVVTLPLAVLIDAEKREADKPKVLTERDLSKQVKIVLRETEDVWILDLPGSYVFPDSLEENLVKASNARYQKVIPIKGSTHSPSHSFIDSLCIDHRKPQQGRKPGSPGHADAQ